MRGGVNIDQAQTLALNVLAFLASSSGALERLMEQSGLDLVTLRDRAADADFQVAILDFLLANEELLVDFCQTTRTEPRAVRLAAHRLSHG